MTTCAMGVHEGGPDAARGPSNQGKFNAAEAACEALAGGDCAVLIAWRDKGGTLRYYERKPDDGRRVCHGFTAFAQASAKIGLDAQYSKPIPDGQNADADTEADAAADPEEATQDQGEGGKDEARKARQACEAGSRAAPWLKNLK